MRTKKETTKNTQGTIAKVAIENRYKTKNIAFHLNSLSTIINKHINAHEQTQTHTHTLIKGKSKRAAIHTHTAKNEIKKQKKIKESKKTENK